MLEGVPRRARARAAEEAGQAADVAGPSPLKMALRSRRYWQIVQVFGFTAIGMHSMIVAGRALPGADGPHAAFRRHGLRHRRAAFGVRHGGRGLVLRSRGLPLYRHREFPRHLPRHGVAGACCRFSARHWLVVPFVLLGGNFNGRARTHRGKPGGAEFPEPALPPSTGRCLRACPPVPPSGRGPPVRSTT